jgi:hypothetical protein
MVEPTAQGEGPFLQSLRTRSLMEPIFYASVTAVAILVFASLWVFEPSSINNSFYSNFDGEFAAWYQGQTLRFGSFLDPSPFNIFGGTGSSFLPNLPWLNPGAWPLVLPIGETNRFALSYAIYIIEVGASIVVLCRVIGLPTVYAFAAALAHVFLLFPPFINVTFPVPWYSLAPFNAHVAAIANLMLAAYLSLGRFGRRTNLALVSAILFLAVVVTLSAPITMLTYLPFYGGAVILLTIFRKHAKNERWWKIGALVIVGVAFVVIFGDYIRGTAAVSARSSALPSYPDFGRLLSVGVWSGLFSQYAVCDLSFGVQVLLCTRYPIGVVLIISLVGAAYGALFLRGDMRVLSIFFIMFVAFVHLYAYGSVLSLWGKLQVFSTPFMMWPTYSALAIAVALVLHGAVHLVRGMARNVSMQVHGPAWARAACGVTRWAAHRVRQSRAGLFAGKFLILAAFPYGMIYYYHNPVMPVGKGDIKLGFNWLMGRETQVPRTERWVPASDGVVLDFLKQNAAIVPDGRFRGYTVSYFGDRNGPIAAALNLAGSPRSASDYVRARDFLRAQFGNHFMATDLWRLDIPTYEEYGQWVSRTIIAFTRTMLASPGDQFDPSMLYTYRLDFEVLRALGVRFVVSDVDIFAEGVARRATQTGKNGLQIHVYEIDRVNLGTYSPTAVRHAERFDATMAEVTEIRTSLDRVVVLQNAAAELPSYVPATKSTTFVVRDGVRVQASSPGRSLLLVPIQYSSCLVPKVRHSDRPGSPVRLYRANGIHVALEFEGTIDVKLLFEFGVGPWGSCRAEDSRLISDFGVP